MLIDQSRVELMRKKCEERLDGLETVLVEEVQGIPLQTPKSKPKREGFNPNSPEQVKHVLAHLGIRVDSTAKKELEKIDHPFARLMIKHRESAKYISSFLKPLSTPIRNGGRIHNDGRIHPEFLQTGAEGGRFSCQKPNLQQIPKEQEWRDLFVAPPGYRIITADYSQIELRILAEYSQDPALLEVFRNGQDLHATTISRMFNVPLDEVTPEQRHVAKSINFGISYGRSASGLAGQLNIPVEEAERFISSHHRAYPQANNTLQRLGMQAVNKGYSETLLGRKRYYKRKDSFAGQKSLERKGRNTPIQGTSADILKKAIQNLMDALHPYDAKIINLVHDEIVLEAEESQAEQIKEVVRKAMERAGRDLIKSVPVKVDIEVDSVWRK
jgi:DNA polymerase-1